MEARLCGRLASSAILECIWELASTWRPAKADTIEAKTHLEDHLFVGAFYIYFFLVFPSYLLRDKGIQSVNSLCVFSVLPQLSSLTLNLIYVMSQLRAPWMLYMRHDSDIVGGIPPSLNPTLESGCLRATNCFFGWGGGIALCPVLFAFEYVEYKNAAQWNNVSNV